jgi:hypothetical protein
MNVGMYIAHNPTNTQNHGASFRISPRVLILSLSEYETAFIMLSSVMIFGGITFLRQSAYVPDRMLRHSVALFNALASQSSLNFRL